jgi:glycosyltransferase involved in cell wall biosynthesis
MISVLIPAFNEAERIGSTIAAIRTALPDAEIVVVDDGSEDETARLAESAGADTVFRQQNAGKGAALSAAFELSRGDVLLLLDADLGATAAEATALLHPVLNGEAEMTIATFPVIPGKGGGMGFVVKLARWGIRRLTGQTMTAPLSGQRAIGRDTLLNAGGFASGWGVEIALTVEVLRNGGRVLEIPTNMTHRVTGRDAAGIQHRLGQFWAALRVLLLLAVRSPKRTASRKAAHHG